jgi:hypothetical protein
VVNKHIKRLSTFSHQENECSHAGQNGYYKKKKKKKPGNGLQDVEEMEPISNVGGDVILCSHCQNQEGRSS